jgi:hypothetical protein
MAERTGSLLASAAVLAAAALAGPPPVAWSWSAAVGLGVALLYYALAPWLADRLRGR